MDLPLGPPGNTVTSECLELKIGGVSFLFSGLDRELLEASRNTYRFFRPDGSKPIHVSRIRSAAPREELPENDFRTGQDPDSGGYYILAPYFRGSANINYNEGVLEIFPCPNSDYKERAIENYIRWIIANILMTGKGGLLLHASASVIDGSAHVFMGPHGSGKSTAVSLIMNGFTIADDVLPIECRGGKVFAAAMPAVHKFRQAEENAGEYPVKCFYWLTKSEKNGLESLHRAAAAGLLMTCAPFIKDTKGYESNLFENVTAILESVPVFNLKFRKEERFLEEALGTLKEGDCG